MTLKCFSQAFRTSSKKTVCFIRVRVKSYHDWPPDWLNSPKQNITGRLHFHTKSFHSFYQFLYCIALIAYIGANILIIRIFTVLLPKSASIYGIYLMFLMFLIWKFFFIFLLFDCNMISCTKFVCNLHTSRGTKDIL